jgi:hypothetical protein
MLSAHTHRWARMFARHFAAPAAGYGGAPQSRLLCAAVCAEDQSRGNPPKCLIITGFLIAQPAQFYGSTQQIFCQWQKMLQMQSYQSNIFVRHLQAFVRKVWVLKFILH